MPRQAARNSSAVQTARKSRTSPPPDRLAGIEPRYCSNDAEHVAAISAFLDQAGSERYSTTEIQTVFPRLDYPTAERLARGSLAAYATKGAPQLRGGSTRRPWEWHAPVLGRGLPSAMDPLPGGDMETRLAFIEQELSGLKSAVLSISKQLTNSNFSANH